MGGEQTEEKPGDSEMEKTTEEKKRKERDARSNQTGS